MKPCQHPFKDIYWSSPFQGVCTVCKEEVNACTLLEQRDNPKSDKPCQHNDKDHIAACGCLCQGTRKLDRLEAEKAALQLELDEAKAQIALLKEELENAAGRM